MSNHGGKRTPGPGKKVGPPFLKDKKRVKTSITLRPDHYKKLQGNQPSEVIEKALDEHFK